MELVDQDRQQAILFSADRFGRFGFCNDVPVILAFIIAFQVDQAIFQLDEGDIGLATKKAGDINGHAQVSKAHHIGRI